MFKRLSLFLLLGMFAGLNYAHATTSTIPAGYPAYGMALTSANFQIGFQAARNDINALWTAVGSGGGLTSSTVFTGTGDCTISGNYNSLVTGCTKTGGVNFGSLATQSAIVTAQLPAITSGQLWVGNGSAQAAGVALSGDATLSNTGVLTLPTVNSNVGTFGTASAVPQITVDGKGRITGVASVTITPAAIGAPQTNGTGASGTWGIAITGNSGTATALAALPSPCGGGQFATGIAANGNAICSTPAGSGNVNAGGTLTSNAIVVGAGTTNVAALGSLGTTTTVLHGNAAGLPTFGAVSISADVSGLGTGVATFLGTPSSANLITALTDETGTGSAVFANSPTFTGTVLGAASTWSNVVTGLNFLATGTGANTLPIGTTGQRPGSPVNGMMRYNTTTPAVEAYVNNAWVSLGAAGGSVSITCGNGINCSPNPITGTATIDLTVANSTKVANYTLAAGDMGGQVNYNASSLTATIPAISGTVFASGMTSLITNYNASALTISTTPTINGYPGTSVGKYGWVAMTSNGTSLDAYGFPGFGTITNNALPKFNSTSGITTASSITDDGTTVTTTEAVSAGSLVLTTPLAVLQGGTGTTTPSIVAGTGIGVTGTWPNQTVAVTGGAGNVTIGTSLAVPNPSVSGSTTTGLSSLAANTFSAVANSIEGMRWLTLASGVDYLTVTPGKSGTAAKIAVDGTTTNQHIQLEPKGTGSIILNTTGNPVLIGTTTPSTIGTTNVMTIKDTLNTGTALVLTGGGAFGTGFAIQNTAAGGTSWQYFVTTTADTPSGGYFCMAVVAGANPLCINTTGNMIGMSTGRFGWGSTSGSNGSNDTAISRVAAGIMGLGTGAAADVSGTFQSKYIQTTKGANVASAATIALTGSLEHITGTAAIDTITTPTGMSSTVGGCVDLIADGAWTTTTAGNIFATMTAVANQLYRACYDGSKWYIK